MPSRYYSNAAVPTSLSASISAAGGVNLLPDDASASFEDGSTGGYGNQFATLANFAISIADGTKALRLIPNNASNDSYANRTFNCSPNTTYTVSGTIRVPAVQTGTFHSSARQVQIYTYTGANGTGSLVASANSAAAANAVGNTRLSVTFTTGATINSFDMRLYNGAATGGGTVYWDGIQIELGSSLSSFSLPSQGSVIPVAAITGFPTVYPYTLTLDKNQIGLGEAVEIFGASGTNLYATRGVDGTTAQAHTAGALVSHDHTARDYAEWQQIRDHQIMNPGNSSVGLKRTTALLGTTATTILTAPASRFYVIKGIMLTGTEGAVARKSNVTITGQTNLVYQQDVSENDPFVMDLATPLQASEVLTGLSAAASVTTAVVTYIDAPANDNQYRLAASIGSTATAYTTIYTAPGPMCITHITASHSGTVGATSRFAFRVGTSGGAFLTDQVSSGGDWINFDSPVYLAAAEVLQVKVEVSGVVNYAVSGLAV